MSEKEENKNISRRQFLKNAGIVVGSTAIGSSAILAACSPAAASDPTTVTTTVTKFVCPYDSQEFDTLAGLQAHVEAEHSGQQTVNKFVCPYDGAEFDSVEELKAYLDANFVAEGEPGVISFLVNGNPVTIKVEDYWTLSFVLRDKLALYSVKIGCEMGQCGTCTVLVDGVPTFSCLVLATECAGKSIETVEGLAEGPGVLSPLQQKFYDHEAFQCGWCTSGFMMAAKALLAENSNPTVDEVREAVAGHLCTCANFKNTIATIAGGV